MSKVDALRALREARYARNRASGPTRREAAAAAGAPAVPAVRAPQEKVVQAAGPAPAADPEGQLCGHKSMNGRACTRETGHAAKSHRYS